MVIILNSEPQSLFNRPEHLEQYKSISTLKYRVDNSEVKPYVEDFENVARDDVLMIANISLEEIQVCLCAGRANVLPCWAHHICYKNQIAELAINLSQRKRRLFIYISELSNQWYYYMMPTAFLRINWSGKTLFAMFTCQFFKFDEVFGGKIRLRIVKTCFNAKLKKSPKGRSGGKIT